MIREGPTAYGAWLLAAAAAAGLALSIVAFFTDAAIGHSIGVLVAIAATALLLLVTLALLLVRAVPGWLRVVLGIGLLLDVLGTGFAAWLLESDLLLAFMAVALLGWLIHALFDRRAVRRDAVRA